MTTEDFKQKDYATKDKTVLYGYEHDKLLRSFKSSK